MEGFGVHILLSCFLKFAIYSALLLPEICNLFCLHIFQVCYLWYLWWKLCTTRHLWQGPVRSRVSLSHQAPATAPAQQVCPACLCSCREHLEFGEVSAWSANLLL